MPCVSLNLHDETFCAFCAHILSIRVLGNGEVLPCPLALADGDDQGESIYSFSIHCGHGPTGHVRGLKFDDGGFNACIRHMIMRAKGDFDRDNLSQHLKYGDDV